MGMLPASTLGDLLKRYRAEAGLTQEQLAEQARMSIEAVSALERGTRRMPRRETLTRLAQALQLPASERAALEVLARHQGVATHVARRSPRQHDTLHLFTQHDISPLV